MTAEIVAHPECGVLHDAGALRQAPCRRPKGHRPFSIDGIGHTSDPITVERLSTADSESEWCRRCGGPNVIWAAASPLWNYVMRGNDINGETKFSDLVCMPCFVLLAKEAGLRSGGWRLTLVPEPEGLIYETPTGRVWDPERFLWVDLEHTRWSRLLMHFRRPSEKRRRG